MKNLGLNLSKMKKVATDGKTSTFQHEDGHQIKILHSALPALHREQLKRLPVLKMADGGGVPAALMPQDEYEANQPVEVVQDVAKPNDEYGSEDVGTDDSLPALNNKQSLDEYNQRTGEASAEDPDLAQDRRIASVGGANQPAVGNSFDQNKEGYVAKKAQSGGGGGSQGSTPGSSESDADFISRMTGQSNAKASGVPAQGLDVQGAYNLGQKAIREQRDNEIALSKGEEPIIKSDLEARAELVDGFKRNTQDFQAHQQQFMKDYMASHINPRSYIENMSSSQKVGTAIGLFLGGLSTPYTHQGNPAMEFLNKQIDRDIEAQKSRIGQQKTLLEANNNLYHDQVLASNATRINLNDMYAHQIQQAAAKLGTPQAKAKADAAASSFALQNAGLLQQSALRATVLHSMAQGGQGLDALDLSHAGLMSREEAEKEQGAVDAQRRAIGSANKYFDDMNEEQTSENFLNPMSMKRVSAANAGLVTSIMEASPTKRLTRESVEAEINPFQIKTTDNDDVRNFKRAGVLDIIRKHADSTPTMSKYAPRSLPSYHVNTMTPEDKQAFIEAQSNQGHPKAKRVMQGLKQKYAK